MSPLSKQKKKKIVSGETKDMNKKKAVLRFSVRKQRGLAQGAEATKTGDITTSMVCK